MKILFLSTYYPEALLPVFKKNAKCGLDFAAHNLNVSLINGFKANKVNFDIINIPHLGSFPPYSRSPFVKSFKADQVESISYLNISYFKRWDIKRRVAKKVENWCSNTQGNKLILLYNFDFLPLIPDLKNQFNDLKICMLVTDLREYMAADNSLLTQFNATVTKLLPSDSQIWYDALDGYILLASKMKEKLPVGNKPWLLMEGIYNSEVDCKKIEKTLYKTILYTGNLGQRYGLIDLLNSFSAIKSDDYRLWICGDGDSLPEYLERQKTDSRIKYFGILPREDILKLQKQATILINPRHSSDDYTKYSFPSKTMEYLASGTPTLMSRLECLPKEYLDHICFFEDESVEGIRDAIEKICSKPQEELNTFGERASRFIFQEKTPKVQVKHIVDFLSKL